MLKSGKPRLHDSEQSTTFAFPSCLTLFFSLPLSAPSRSISSDFASDGPNAETVINRVLHLLLLTEGPMDRRISRKQLHHYCNEQKLASALCRQLDGEMCTFQYKHGKAVNVCTFIKGSTSTAEATTRRLLRVCVFR